jgi:hypothetical protein
MTDATPGPVFTYGDLTKLQAATFGSAVPDPNQDAGPSATYQADGFIDIRFLFQKDKVNGYTGVIPAHIDMPFVKSVGAVPAALASNNIAAAQTVASGVALTLAGASVGITPNVPARAFAAALNGGAVTTTGLALDFGFEFGNCTAGSANITVANANDFTVGMPLVIGNVGNAGGTIPLLTQVTSINTTTNVITVNASYVPLATNATAPIGTGDAWGPSPVGFPIPQAALPWIAAGPGLFLDSRQGIARGVQISGVAGGTGGTFTVRSLDIFGVAMSETITVAAGASTGWGKKAHKYIISVTPNFTDGTHNYSVGTSDVFGMAYRNRVWEATDISWGGTFVTTNVGWLAADMTNPATSITGDVRGTTQVSANGGGTPIAAANASNGVITSLVMTGRRLEMAQFLNVADVVAGTAANPTSIYGQTQA